MKVDKCNCESKEPELSNGDQIKKQEGVYKFACDPDSPDRVIVVHGSIGPITLLMQAGQIMTADYFLTEFIRTSETLCVGLKDAAGKWVE